MDKEQIYTETHQTIHLPVVSRTEWRTWEARSDGAEMEVGVRSHWAFTVLVNTEEAVWRLN